jgi:hypothetical protein
MMRWNIVLRLSSRNVPEKIDFSRLIVNAMTGNEYFPTPSPDLKTISRLSEELQLAYEISREGTKEQTALMYAKEFELDTQLNVLGSYVEAIANNDSDVGDAIIFSAGMDVKGKASRQEQVFEVKNTAYAGIVDATSSAEPRASYLWEYSLDQENWSVGSVSNKANTTIKGLTPGKRYYFRVAIVKGEQGPWQGPIDLIVT